MQNPIQLLCAICFTIIGLSHVLQPSAWEQFFKLLLRLKKAGAFLNGFITLPQAVLLICFHPVWKGPAAVLTILGWCYLVKAVVAFCFPALALRSIQSADKRPAGQYQVVGIFLLLLAGLSFFCYFYKTG
jgi:uncharacterized protein YjeT (DUF2065 family)